MLRKLTLVAGLVTILGIAAFFAPHDASAATLNAAAALVF